MDVDSIADRPYRMPPGQFVAARNEAANQPRVGVDRDPAARIRALRGPTCWRSNTAPKCRGCWSSEPGCGAPPSSRNRNIDTLAQRLQET